MPLPRRVHIIRANAQCRLPKRFLVFDTETESKTSLLNGQSEYHVLKLWCFQYYRVRKGKCELVSEGSGESCHDFWSEVSLRMSRKETLWVFAHNIPFDLTVTGFWALCMDRKFNITRYVVEDPPTIISAENKLGRIKLVDTLNYWPMALEKLGQSGQWPKLRMPTNEDSRSTWIEYCRRDVDILAQHLSALIEGIASQNLGNFQPTASGIAWGAYRHRFMAHKIIVHDNASALAIERGSYYGGRCDVWRLGKVDQKVCVLDVNSLYPYVMHEFPYPFRLRAVDQKPSIASLANPPKDCEAAALVRLNTPLAEFPVKRDGETLYAVGGFDTYLCGPELQRALRIGIVKKVFALAWYEVAYLFQDFVEYFCGRKIASKASGDLPSETLAKLMVNSLSGKFAQRGVRWQDDSEAVPEYAFGSWTDHGKGVGPPIEYRSIGWKVQRKVSGKEWYDSCPAISGWITSHAREYMQRLRAIAGIAQCFYTDTDSLHTTVEGMERLKSCGYLHPTAIGKLKVQSVSNSAHYYGWKDYEIDSGRVTVGLKKTAIRTPNGTWIQPEFERLANMVAHAELPYVVVKEREFKTPLSTVRGKVLDNGVVMPVELFMPDPYANLPFLQDMPDMPPHTS